MFGKLVRARCFEPLEPVLGRVGPVRAVAALLVCDLRRGGVSASALTLTASDRQLLTVRSPVLGGALGPC